MRPSDRFWKFVWRYLTPFIAGFVIYASATSIGPAWRAHQGDGARGMVTVTQKDCSGRGGCSYSGDFVSTDGRDRRSGVGLASGFSHVAVGVRVLAVDTGDPDNVYPPGGGHDWMLWGLFLAGSIGALLAWIYLVAMNGSARHGRSSRGQHSDGGVGAHRATMAVVPGTQARERFTVVRLREGYDIDDVEAFLARVRSGELTSAEARSARFRPVRIRAGYSMSEVDDYIDSLADQLSASGR